MNNKRNSNSIYSFNFFSALILSCIFFVLCFSIIGCEIIAEESSATVETVDNTTESENIISEPETQEETEVVEIELPEENIEEGLPENEGETIDEVNTNESINIKVYYANEMGEFLVGESRALSYDQRYVDALIELLKVPIDNKLIPLIPDTTKIYSVEVEEGVAKIDMSSNFVDDRFDSDTVDILLVYSIVNTLTEFPDINSVSFYIEGEKLNTLGMLDLSGPLYRKNDLIIR